MKRNLSCAISLLLILSLSFYAFSEEAMILSSPNPWLESSAEEILELDGVHFVCPEDAENILYHRLPAERISQMQFDLAGIHYTARIQPADAFTDISGMYYEWNSETKETIGYLEATILKAAGENEQAALCLFYDAAPGLMYSLSAVGEEAADILAAAKAVYVPVQGECGGDSDAAASSETAPVL